MGFELMNDSIKCNIAGIIYAAKNAAKDASSDGKNCVMIVSSKVGRKEVRPMDRKQDTDIGRNLGKALKTKVTDSVREEISGVLNVNTERMTAGQAIAYAQVAKAIKGDKNAFETILNAVKSEDGNGDKPFSIEIKVVD